MPCELRQSTQLLALWRSWVTHSSRAAKSAKIACDASLVVAEGAITTCLKDVVERQDGDLVVIGRARDQDTFEHLLSHVYDIVRESPVPVLSI